MTTPKDTAINAYLGHCAQCGKDDVIGGVSGLCADCLAEQRAKVTGIRNVFDKQIEITKKWMIPEKNQVAIETAIYALKEIRVTIKEKRESAGSD